MHIMDTTDPVLISKLTQRLNLKKTLFLVSSKSGTTLEITSLFKYFYNLSFEKIGNNAGGRFIFITDKGSPLVKIAKNISAYHIFFSNSNIGGRYSALSLPGIVPAAIIGVDVEKLLQRATDTSQAEKLNAAGAIFGRCSGHAGAGGTRQTNFYHAAAMEIIRHWLEQLIAESTGKEGKGILPVLDEPFFNNASYGKDRVFVFFQNNEEAKTPQMEFLINAGHPVITIRLNDDYDLGAQMFIWEMATAVAGHIMGINPFDQPNVEATKKYTRDMITEHKEKKSIKDTKPALTFAQGSVFGNISGATL